MEWIKMLQFYQKVHQSPQNIFTYTNSYLNSEFWYGIFIIVHGWTDFCVFSVLFCSLLLTVFISVFVALLVILSLLSLVIMGGQHNGVLLSGNPPVAYIWCAHLYFSWQTNTAAAALDVLLFKLLLLERYHH